MGRSFDLIKEWTARNRPQVEPDHQCERYAWFRDNIQGRILSIGCGEAKVEEYMYIKEDGQCDYSQPVCGADISDSFIESARRRWPAGKFVKYDICHDVLGFSDNEFDTIIMGDVVEHIPPYYFHKLMSDAIRVCKRGGNILITTPNGSYFDDHNPSSIYSSDHVIVMTPEVFGDLLEPRPEARGWWIRDGRARHGFKYGVTKEIPTSKRFIFAKISNGKE